MKEDSIIKIEKINDPDEDELLMLEAFPSGRPAAAAPAPAEDPAEEVPLDMLLDKKGIIYDDKIVQERERLLNLVVGKTFTAKYRWLIWDDPNMSEAIIYEGCQVSLEDHCLLFYDGTGELEFRLPLNQLMFRAFESLISLAWFDEEMDSVYYSVEMFVELY